MSYLEFRDAEQQCGNISIAGDNTRLQSYSRLDYSQIILFWQKTDVISDTP